MKQKIVIPVVLVVLAGAALFLMPTGTHPNGGMQDPRTDSTENSPTPMTQQAFSQGADSSSGLPMDGDTAAEPDIDEEEIKSAAQVYSSAGQALEAIKKGAAEFNDVVLEQFRTPGEDCTWCPELYANLAELIKQPTIGADELLYYGQVLALSGRPENLQVLANLVTGTTDEDRKDQYAQALEFTIGGSNVVTWLGEQIHTPDERLHESVIAALTNQNSRQAAELIYKRTVERNNPGEFYEVGIGLGEFIPSEEAIPYLQELFLKRDKFSPLAVKALLNGGLPGVRIVAEALMNSTDTAGDKALLEGAVEHVILDEPTIEFLHQVPNNTKNQALIDWAHASLNAEAAGGDDELIVEEE